MRVRRVISLCALSVLIATHSWAQTPAIRYRVTFPEPEHHWLEIEATFTGLDDGPLRARMSRSSPGRYAVHEFAKNVFSVRAWNGAGQPLTATRPDADEWRIAGHDGTVRIVYRLFGDYADGTYMAVDTTHAHLNMPATFMWALGLETRPIAIVFEPPAGSGWTVGTQLFPTPDPFTFTAPNLQYFMDSPTELARLVESAFSIAEADGRQVRFRLLAHTDSTQNDLDALARMVERLVREQRAIFGAFPSFEPGYYTFLLDYVGWVNDDAMEHRNSTYISDPGVSLRTPAGRRSALDAISHEFFHVWNVERIRPADLEPFDFTRANVTCCLWLAEGFTQYYGTLTLARAGFSPTIPWSPVTTVMTSPAPRVRSLVEVSEHAPFADAAVANDVDDRSRTFLSYYTFGSAVALALDFTIRSHSAGRLSLDDYMRRLWERYGAVATNDPGTVARPYTLDDLERELGALVGDTDLAGVFFTRYVRGRERPDYPALLAQAGYLITPIAPGRGWLGAFSVQETTAGLMVGGPTWNSRASLVPFDTPAHEAGLDRGDLVTAIDGQPATMAAWVSITARTPGDRVVLTIRRRDGSTQSSTVTLAADPSVKVEDRGETGGLRAAERAFRAAWLGSRVPN